MPKEEKPLTPDQKFALRALFVLIIWTLISLWLFSYWMRDIDGSNWKFLPSCVTGGMYFAYLVVMIQVARDKFKGN
jgi:hypothetical protein